MLRRLPLAPVPGTGGRLLAPGGDLRRVPTMDRAESSRILRANPLVTAGPLCPAAAPRFPSSLRSPLEGVPLPAWQRFVAALEVQRMDEVSMRGGFGSYDLRPKRLEELGLVTDLHRQGGRARRGQPQIYTCQFVLPWTEARFLADPQAQLEALSRSMQRYQEDLQAGRIVRPAGLSLAGALALLHCGGRGALASFPHELFPHTRAVSERARGAF